MKVILRVIESGYKYTWVEIEGEMAMVEKLAKAVKSAARKQAPYCEIR